MVGKKVKRLIRSKEALYLLITIIIVLGFYINNSNFLSLGTLRGAMQSMSITGIMAVAVAMLFIGGGIDLSMSMVCLFGGIVCALLIRADVPWGLAIVITLAIGACVGGLNAIMIAKFSMMPFIATIALANVVRGVNLALTDTQPVAITVESFNWGANSMFGIFPYPFVIMCVLLIIYGLILSKTQFGRNIYLVGGNMQAARLSGINPTRIRTVLYINAGVMSSLSGIVLASRMRNAIATTVNDSQMEAITATILGGIAFGGGSGGMVGCFIGILMLNLFNAGLYSLALDAYWTTIASGALLLIALTTDFFNEKSRAKSLRSKSGSGDTAVVGSVSK